MNLLLFSIVAVVSQQATGTPPGQIGFVNVNSKLGPITGIKIDLNTLNHTVYKGQADVFLGIPYVEAPIGNLRFQLPQPKRPWTTILNATTYNTRCPQARGNYTSAPDVAEDEDCLHMNIYRPMGIPADAKLPVMIWLYGGGFFSGWLTYYSPTEGIITNLVSKGVIVVTINYRIGVFGFFTTYTNDFPSNLGLRDQVAAFKWVRSNIDSFGGDPAKVTIFGESSGACGVSIHTISPMSVGTFDQGIIQSTALAGQRQSCLIAANISAPNSNNVLIAKRLCNITDIDWQAQSFAGLRNCLLEVPWQTIMNITSALGLVVTAGLDGPGGFLPDNPENLVKNRKNIPMIIGANRDEGATEIVFDYIFGGVSPSTYNEQKFDQMISDPYVSHQTGGESMMDVVYPLLDSLYRQSACPAPPSSNDSITLIRTISEVLSDVGLRSVTLLEAKLWRDLNKNSNVYLYDFGYAGDAVTVSIPGLQPSPVVHTEELCYTFLWEGDGLFNLSALSSSDRSMVDYMGTMWTNFAKYGNPTPANINSSLPFTWQPFDATNNYLSIENGGIGMKTNYYPKADQIFNQIIPNIAKKMQQSAPTPTAGNGIDNRDDAGDDDVIGCRSCI